MAHRKAIFIDRGGVLHQEFPRGTTGKPRDLVFEKGALTALRKIDPDHFLVFLFDNADGVAFGHYSEAAYNRLTHRMLNAFRRRHIHVDGIYTCLQHPKGKGKYCGESVFRFPNIGLFKQAQQEHELNLESCWVIGDRTREVLAAQRAGCQTILVRTGMGGSDGEFYIEPDSIEANLLRAVQFIGQQELALTR